MRNVLNMLVLQLATEEVEKILQDTDIGFLHQHQHKTVVMDQSKVIVGTVCNPVYLVDCEIWTFITPKAGPKNLVVCDAVQQDGKLLINWDRTPKWNETLPRTNYFELADPTFPANLAQALKAIVLEYDLDV